MKLASILRTFPIVLSATACTIFFPPPKLEQTTEFPADKGGPDIRLNYARMKHAFSAATNGYTPLRIASAQSGWEVFRSPSGQPLSREVRTYVGVEKRPGTCELLIVSFAQDNQGGSDWGDVYIKHWGMQLDPSSLHFVGTVEAPFPATCEVIWAGMKS